MYALKTGKLAIKNYCLFEENKIMSFQHVDFAPNPVGTGHCPMPSTLAEDHSSGLLKKITSTYFYLALPL
jgi:hypothetical protein